MTRRQCIGVFEREEDILEVTRAVCALGWKIADVHTPYAVHGLDRAMGLRASRLSLVCLLAGFTGAVLKLWFEIWTAAVDWPVNVGGKPWNSLPAFVPITFEVMVLFAGVFTVLAFFVVSGLRPGRKAALIDPSVTNDRFALILDETDASFDLERARLILSEHNAVRVEERVVER